MLKEIVKGYSQIILSILKILSLLVLCGAIGLGFVYPLWYFASEFPQTYTAAVLLIIALLFIFWSFNKIRNSGFKRTVLFLVKALIIAGGICAFVFLVLSGKRFWTIPVVAAVLVLYGFFNFAFKSEPSNNIDDKTDEE